ncbi:MAG: energy transducer TonB, partial [Gammaproteobacteria bacterium]|nr:energy transducer TonB [Gammaproteobacteria bacterium]
EVILVPNRSERAPENADYLAQSNQEGGGDAADKRRPTSPNPAMVTTADDTTSPEFMPQIKQQPLPEDVQREVLTAVRSDYVAPDKKPTSPQVPELKTPTAEDLVRRGQEIARVNASLGEISESNAKRPRPKFLTGASAKEYKYASYMADWDRKIEKVGSVNFPDEARRRNLKGDLLLDVAINPDGTIVDVTIRRSSGQKILDDAALRIVHLSAPFAPFPASFLKDFNVLHITRTWQFLPGGMLDTK